MASTAKLLKEDVNPKEISLSDLTTDCLFVHLADGTVDIVRSPQMVKAFDMYHDAGKKVVKIEVSGGRLNPKTQDPNV